MAFHRRVARARRPSQPVCRLSIESDPSEGDASMCWGGCVCCAGFSSEMAQLRHSCELLDGFACM